MTSMGQSCDYRAPQHNLKFIVSCLLPSYFPLSNLVATEVAKRCKLDQGRKKRLGKVRAHPQTLPTGNSCPSSGNLRARTNLQLAQQHSRKKPVGSTSLPGWHHRITVDAPMQAGFSSETDRQMKSGVLLTKFRNYMDAIYIQQVWDRIGWSRDSAALMPIGGQLQTAKVVSFFHC